MTYRERKERRLARRLEWAESRKKKADASFRAADAIASQIPLGQPILVGHHSERHARRDQERIRSGMDRGCENLKMSQHHGSIATEIERQLDKSIYSDDRDAADRLRERIAETERKAADHAAINRAWRKGGQAELAALTLPSGVKISEKLAERCAKVMADAPWLNAPLDIGHLRASIRQDKKRLAELLLAGEGSGPR
jgi:hypothetical protein